MSVHTRTCSYRSLFTLLSYVNASQLTAQLGVRAINPFSGRADEDRFLQAAKALFMNGRCKRQCTFQSCFYPSSPIFSRLQGHVLGTNTDLGTGDAAGPSPPADLVNNHMSQILFQYFQSTKRYQLGVRFFSAFVEQEPAIAALLAPYYFALDDEITGFELLYKAQCRVPLQSVPLITTQADYLWKVKKQLNMAIELYRSAVDLEPSDARHWLALAE